ncbi:MAG: DNA internalization-related competence protein ComEC/Rec2, partial [Gemmatimonadota bacterium]
VRWREAMVTRLEGLYGERAPLVAALTLARREGLDPELRDAFARVGIAHLLAISGFHVGVVAGVLVSLLLAVRVEIRRAALLAAAGAWLYVGFIGFPDAACRAALILTAAAFSRGRGRPAARWGAIGAALLVLLVLDPSRLASAGFQLSFAGAAGLVAWSGALSRAIRSGGGRYCPRGVAMAVAAGLAATLATLPVVAWHFERVSVVGIPMTLVAAPLVTLALIGSLGSLVVDFVSHGLAAFVAGGVGWLLAALEWLSRSAGSVPWASVWITRGTVVGGVAGVLAALWVARRPGVGRRARRTLTAVYVACGVVAWPVLLALQGRGAAEVVMIDVGQGDAIALRSPDGRWLLVDTGPASDGVGPAGHPVVRALRSRGIGRLEALVLTHPDLDHIGGAAAVLESFEVGVVYDPGLPAGKDAFVEALSEADARSVPWRAARAGDSIVLGDLGVRVLYPPVGLSPDVEANASSVVLLASLGDFDVLLTGDAYKDVDRLVATDFDGALEVLKVGHHGSDTSTDPALLDSARPRLGLVSVGRFNRYGHPAPEVLRRLEDHGVEVHRTDREGTITVLGRRDGSYSVSARR